MCGFGCTPSDTGGAFFLRKIARPRYGQVAKGSQPDVSPESSDNSIRLAGDEQVETDAELVSRFQAGDVSAFDVLHSRHFGRVYGLLRNRGLDHADAADVAQEAFLRMVRFADGFDPTKGEFGHWLMRIAINCLRSHWTGRGRRDGMMAGVESEQIDASAGPAELAAKAERDRLVDKCVRKLPRPLKRIVRMRYVDGWTTRQIAAAVGVSEASVRNRLNEAREILTASLAAAGLAE